ncbi:MAG: DMT family transporter [Granulosicoccus sp.]
MNSPLKQAPGLTDIVLLVTLSALFGVSFMFTEFAVSEIPPLTVSGARVFLALLILWPLMKFAGQRLPGFGYIWLPAIASAIFGYALPFALVSWGQLQVSSSLAAIFMAIMPLFTIVLAHLFTRDEKLNTWKVAGVVCGLLGVIVLFGADSLRDLGGPHAMGQLAILGAAVCYAINALITRALVNTPRLSMLTCLMLIGSAIMVLASFWFDAPFSLNPSWQAIGALVVLAVGPTATATLMILVIIKRQGASFLSQINFLVPLFGVLLGWLLLDDRLTTSDWIALLIVLTGVALSHKGNT